MGLPLSVPLIANEAVKPLAPQETASLSALIGKGILISIGAACISAILYTRLISGSKGLMDEEVFKEEHVVTRAKQTLYYLVGSIGIATISCVVFSQLPSVVYTSLQDLRFTSVCTITIASLFSGVWLQGLPYEPKFGIKHIAWIIHSTLVGAVMAPVLMIEKFILAKSAGFTLFIFGELALLAICVNHVTFLSLGLLLPIGSAVLMLGTIASYMREPTSITGVILHGIIVHGGLIVISFHILNDTQTVAGYALWCNREGSTLFDPINASLNLFMDVVKIYIRVAAVVCLITAKGINSKSS